MKTPLLKYIISLLILGSNGIVSSLIHLNSYEIVFLRTMVGSVVLIAIFLLTGGKFTFYQNKKDALFLLISGMALGGSWMFLYEAYASIGVGVASLCYYCGPMIVMMLSPVVFNEKLTAAKIAGFIAVVLGVCLVNGRGSAALNSRGLFSGLMSAVIFAIMVIFNKKAKSITGLENSALQVLISFLTVAAFVGIKQGYNIPLQTSEIPAMLFLGVVNTGIACYLYFSSIGRLPVQTVSILGYLEPLAAVVFSALLLNEKMSSTQMLGAALILGGAIFTEYCEIRNRSVQI